MAFHTSKIFTWLFFIFVGTVFFVLYQENLTVNINWTTFSRNFETVVTKWNREQAAPGPIALNATAPAKWVTSMPVTEFEGERENVSTRGVVVVVPVPVPETPMPILLKKDFSKLPVWDFEDVYNQDAAPPNGSCRESLRNSKEKSFMEAFLPNIRLFLHKSNINMSEWNRLSHFNNPFGFMGFSYNDVISSVKLIPEPKEPLLSPKPGGDGCIRCAVVGTAGILNGSKMGKEIDAHDYVFRMNGAVIKGYEEDVGNKTSVYVHTAHSITMSLYLFKKYGYKSAPHDEGIKYVMIPEGMRDFQWLQGLLRGERVSLGSYKNKRPRTYYTGQYNESRFYVLHQDFLRYVRNRFLKSPHLNGRYWTIVRPTNGAFTIFLALHTCDRVDVYGFMTRDYAKYSNYYFEKHDKSRVIFYANHDYILEMKTWEKLHNDKILRLYQRNEKEPPPTKT
ncbi:alpha-N-acetylgalactosaminide alpha-2,6-sialyltransferase 1-like [Syngnathoides biaculeatus]|uniref:alpha-N-acetylgalactosaminide alpha-2,6-sialyltransferase 1-like n=1 Tax=Syngnathoides biaculeatus TaxID=300417 RepID=UPI002ADDE151|nr:alpha-N-acetylgalactosaminide alpha-2,6-sialyltransferase 1-like [Syngnathoides biaculeatus]XP_061667345.1 alpha-N-acetylgalactosaminide alpha-2,6-sialyltransferase 1-like [Syngnathoides biaculeatus]XP_061667346.1 alpha-N-acetylgalactosaminide alpha-2,6-sialyltransferase 1-like [Syngnathoides biaculeatus]